jgi:hypothetical protein
VFAVLLLACSSDAPSKLAVVQDAGISDAAAPQPDAGCTSELACAPIRLAFTRLFVSDARRDETLDPGAWQSYGENLDGLVSGYYGAGTPRRECMPSPMANPPDPPVDPSDGTDNVWGQTILPKLLHWDATPTKSADQWLAAGHRGPIIALGRLDGELGASSLRAFFTYIEHGAVDPVPTIYPTAHFANGTFDSGPAGGAVVLELPIGADTFVVAINNLRVKLDLGANLVASGGILAGAIYVRDLREAIITHIARLKPADCASGQLDDLLATVDRSADVLGDGTNDPSRECDAISFGAGFEASQVTVTGVSAGPAAEPPLPGDAGCP